MDSGLRPEPVIGPRDFARARWAGPGMTQAACTAALSQLFRSHAPFV